MNVKLPYWASQIIVDKRCDRFVVTGGLGCLRGDVEIQTFNGLKRIDQLNHQELVLSYDHSTNQYCYALASVSFPKGRGNLYQVSGQQVGFVANESHRVFSASHEYLEVKNLTQNDELLYFQTPVAKSEATCFLKFLLDAPHLMRKALGLLYCYLALGRRYDLQLLKDLNICLSAVPSLADALKLFHIFYPFVSFDADDLRVRLHEHTQMNRYGGQIQMTDYVVQSSELVAALADREVSLFFERALLASSELKLSLLMFFYHHKDQLISSCHISNRLLQSFDLSRFNSVVSNTTSVALNKIDDNSVYYDITVERTGNYITKDGTIHHNSGKSTTGLLSFISYILLNPKAKFWWVCAPTHARIEDSMIPAAVFALDCLGRKAGLHYTLRKSKPQTITIHQTGQEIRFISADRPEHMVSATLGGYFITEAFRIKREVYENIESRTRSNQLERTLGILEGTPEGDTWGKKEFNIQGIDIDRKLRRFILHTHDNAHNLNPDYIPRLFQIYAHSPAMIKSYIYGEFSSFRLGDVFAQFVESRNVIDDIKPDPMRKIALCFDFNATPLTWSAWQTVPYKVGHIIRHRDICIAESSLDCRNLFDASLEVGKTFDPDIYKNTPFELWGDRTGHASSHKSSGTDFSNLRDYLSEIYNNVEIKAPREVTPIRASVDVFNRLLLYEMILICQSCKNMRRSLNMTKWAIGKDDLEKKQGETHTHHSDGARYRIWKLYKSADIDNILENSTTIAGINPA